MLNIILVSHGKLAQAMISSAEMIVGQIPNLFAVELAEADAPEAISARMAEIIESNQAEEGTLILVDLPGATPFNEAASFAYENSSVSVVSGLNLPMLLEAVLQRDSSSLIELEGIAKKAGKTGVMTLADFLNN